MSEISISDFYYLKTMVQFYIGNIWKYPLRIIEMNIKWISIETYLITAKVIERMYTQSRN